MVIGWAMGGNYRMPPIVSAIHMAARDPTTQGPAICDS
jgi:hypothetical protein